MATPAISVLMPVYNCQPYLAKAMDSVLQQSFTDFELIVIDDGSTDGSSEILRAYAGKDARIRLHKQDNAGLPLTLRRGQELCQAPYIARMDGDDIAYPERLEKQLAFMEANTDVGISGACARVVDAEGAPMQNFQPPCKHTDIDAKLMKGQASAIIHPLAFMRREALLASGGYLPESELEDLDLFLRMAEHTQTANLSEVLLDYRMHLSSTNYQRRQRHIRLTQETIARAWLRRNLPGECPQLTLPHRDDNLASIHADWARTAFTGGYFQTGLKHCWQALLAQPASLATWGEFLRSLKWGLHCRLHRQGSKN